MSISGKIAMIMLRTVSGLFGNSSRISSVEDEIRKGKEISEKNLFVMPKDKKAKYTELHICGYPCLVMRKKQQEEPSKGAILYLHGGIQNIWKSEISIARGYMDKTDTDVWYPIYPALTEVPVMKSIQVCFETYSKMVQTYGAENIAVVGGSFGGYYALQLINRINVLKSEIGMPGLVIALSPGGVPDDEESLRKMEELSKHDSLINMPAVLQIKDLAKWYDRDSPDYTIYPSQENFCNAPETYLYYAEETLAGNADCYARAFQMSGCIDRLHIHIQPNMMHCYACMPIFPESKEAYNQQIELIKACID